MSEDETIDPATEAGAEWSPRGEGGTGRKGFLGPYRIIEEIGRGGMGVVYKAFHLHLKRTVALKVLIAGEDASEEAITRFHREAEAVAKLGHHPNIVPVYDIGHVTRESIDGLTTMAPLHYFAMHLVEGESLEERIDQGEMTPKMAASFTKRIARGLAHAHSHGVLHRDLKPANILVSREGEPQITDFGLAKAVESDSKLTHSGATIGTPQYMPPEQADGRLRDIDEKSDVYSLGATLYEMLTFTPPFEGDTVIRIIHKVLQEDPVPPRKKNSIVDRDLETICLKCLEKDPKRRDGSAEALASDIERYQKGEPIEARPAGLLYRAVKTAKRHRAVVATATVLSVLLLAAVIIGSVVTARMEREKEEESKRAEDAEDKAEDAFAMRDEATRLRDRNAKVAKVMMAGQAKFFMIHRKLKASYYDSTRSSVKKREAFRRHEKDMEAFFAAYVSVEGEDGGSAGRAAALALKGWMVRLSGDEEHALSLFEQARESDPDVGWAHLFEAMAWLSNYLADKQLPTATMGHRGVLFDPMPPETANMKELRSRCEKALERLSGAGRTIVWGPELSGGFAGAIAGLSEIFDRDTARAERSLSALLELPEFFWMEEEILRARSIMRYVLRKFDAGGEDAAVFLERCPDNGAMHSHSGDLLRGKGLTISVRGQDPRALFEEAVSAYDRSMKRNPRSARTLCNRGLVRNYLGIAQAQRGVDPRDTYAMAIADLNEAEKYDPRAPTIPANRGIVYKNLASARTQLGLDSREALSKSIADFTEAQERLPGQSDYHNNLGVALKMLGAAYSRQGKDPLDKYKKAVREFKTALKINPDYVMARTNLGGTYESMGCLITGRGGDSREYFQKAIAQFGESLEKYPDDAVALNDRGKTYKSLGLWEVVWRKDARPAFRKAIADFEEALKRNPEFVSAWNNRGVGYLKLGDAQEQRGGDSLKSYQKAQESFRAALERNPSYGAAHNNLGNAHQSVSRALTARGKDPRASYRKAIEAYEGALKIRPRYTLALFNLGNAWRRLGEVESGSGNDPSELFQRAVQRYGEALKINPSYRRAHIDRLEASEEEIRKQPLSLLSWITGRD
jgi:tetratricopeptide (TPR) repeat protein